MNIPYNKFFYFWVKPIAIFAIVILNYIFIYIHIADGGC